MTILTRLMESRASYNFPPRPLTDATLIQMTQGLGTHTGVPVNEESAMKVIAVYRAVSLVSGAVAQLPFRAFRDGPAHEPFRSPLLDNPHPDMTPMELWEMVMSHLLLWGNCYCSIERDGNDGVVALDPLPPSRVKAERVTTNQWGKQYKVRMDDGRDITLTPRELMHVRGPGYNGLYGLSPIGVAREGISMAVAAEQYGARLFGSGSLMSGILQTDQELTREQAEAIKQRWKDRVSGLDRAHEVAIIDKGAKYQPISMNPEDAQFLQSRQFQVVEIARLYGIPPHLLGEVTTSTSWGTGIEQQGIGFVVYTLAAWLTRLEQKVSKVALPPGVSAQFNTDRLTRGDVKTRAEAAMLWVQNGIKTFNQVLLEEGLPPREDGDQYMTPNNWTVTDPTAPPMPMVMPDNVTPIQPFLKAARESLDRLEERMRSEANV